MSGKTEAEIDVVAEAIANAPKDDRPMSDEERHAIAEARANPQWVHGDVVSAEIAERARREAKARREG